MNSAKITRANYLPEYVYFILSTGRQIECLGPDFTVALFSEQETEAQLQAYLDKHAVLPVSVSKAAIVANGVDSTLIALNPPQNANYKVLAYNIQIASGNTADGAIEFATLDAGEYYIELQNANGQTGYAKVVANAS